MALRLPRLIPRLAVKGKNVVVTVQMEGLRVIGNAVDLARQYAEEADEILYFDCVASLYGQNHLEKLLEETTADVFVPVTVGGGIRSLADIRRLLVAGADKIAINSAAILSPELINQAADRLGSQAIVASIEAKRLGPKWEAVYESGRQRSGLDALAWAEEAARRGAGEIRD